MGCDGVEDGSFFEVAHSLVAEGFFFVLVLELGVGEDFVGELLGCESVGVVSVFVGDVGGGDGGGVDVFEFLPELGEVPVFLVGVVVVGDGVGDGFGEDVLDVLLEVGFVVDDFVAVVVEGFALAVEDVVVFEGVFALFGVLLFDVCLGVGDDAADDFVFEGHVVGCGLEEFLGCVLVEEAHEVVGEG